MVCRVLHDVVHKCADLEWKSQVHSGRYKRLSFRPSATLLVPRYINMGVVHIDHKTNHADPKEKRYSYTHQKCQSNRLVGSECGPDHRGYPQNSKARGEQAVFDKNGPTCWHVFLIGEHHLVPPNFDHVVQARCPTAAIDPVFDALFQRQGCVFFRRVWRPDKVKAFEVGVAVVDYVVTDVPQAVGGEGRQESNTT